MKINSQTENDVTLVTVKLNPLEELVFYLPWIGDWIARRLVTKIKRISEKEGKTAIIEWG